MSQDDDASKDKFFQDVGAIADRMILAHGKDFAMGTLVLAARWIAENKKFTDRVSNNIVQ